MPDKISKPKPGRNTGFGFFVGCVYLGDTPLMRAASEFTPHLLL